MNIPLFVGYEATRSLGNVWQRGTRVELDGRALPRHTFVCGSTGSGKTVFAKAMVEEAILQGIPTIVLDVKGDLASLALTGADVDSKWMKRVLGSEHAAASSHYEDGLAEFPAVQDRVQDFADRVHPRLFTPGSSLGRQLALASLPSLQIANADSVELESFKQLNEAFSRALVSNLYGASAVRRKSKDEEIRVIEVLNWRAIERGKPFQGPEGIKRLANQIMEPPIAEIGGLPYEEFLPPKRQAELRRRLASSLAGAGANWYRGETLSVEKLIGDAPAGRVPLAIVYLGHLNDFEQQAFVVARVAAEIYQWMRGRGGSERPRLLLYMDEVGGGEARTGFFPSAPFNPVSKSPLSLLVKQGRSAGVATLLATQNPVSVDLRALSNVHTWAVGRLTQKNDQARVQGALSEGHVGGAELRAWLPQLPTHTFLVKSEGSGFATPRPVKERWLYTLHEVLGIDAVKRLGQELAARDWSAPQERVADRRPKEPGGPRDRSAVGADLGTRGTRGGSPADAPPETGTLPLTRDLGPESAAEAGGWHLSIAGASAMLCADGRAASIGRSSKADVQLDDRYASGKHVEFRPKGTSLVLRDLDSRNAAQLEGEELRGTVTLEAEASPVTLVVGKTDLVFSWG